MNNFTELAMRTLPDGHGYNFAGANYEAAIASLNEAMSLYVDGTPGHGPIDLVPLKVAGDRVDQIKRLVAYGKLKEYESFKTPENLTEGSDWEMLEKCEHKHLHIYHMILGMITEVIELAEILETNDYVNMAEELGDIMWYRAGLDKFFSTEHMPKGTTSFDAFMADESEPSEADPEKVNVYIKSLLFSDAMLELFAWVIHFDERADVAADLYAAALYVEMMVSGIVDAAGLNMLTVGTAVIDKLAARYPDKFDAEKATNRNLTAERNTLEGALASK